MAYFDTKKGSLEEAIKDAVKNEKLDPVNKTAVKKKFDDRKDKDIDNDGDVDSSDKFLHKRRKAISKAMSKEETKKEAYEFGTREATTNSLNVTPGQSVDDWDKQVGIMQEKNVSMREALAKMWGVDEGNNPFKKEEIKTSKKEGKTMTGKPETKVTIGTKEK